MSSYKVDDIIRIKKPISTSMGLLYGAISLEDEKKDVDRYVLSGYVKTYYESGELKRAIHEDDHVLEEYNFNMNGMLHGRHYYVFDAGRLWNLTYKDGYIVEGVFFGSKIVYIKNNTVYKVDKNGNDVIEKDSTQLLRENKLKALL